MTNRRRWIFALIAAGVLLGGCANKEKREETDPDFSAEQLYNKGRSYLVKGRYAEALTTYQTLEARYPYGRFTEQAQLETAYAHYKNSEPDLAVTAAERFIRLHPTDPGVDYAYYLKGLALFDDRRDLLSKLSGSNDPSARDAATLQEAFNTFKELVARFPSSRYVPDSRQRMAYLLNVLAQHDVNVARYYLKRGAYVAVVNRARHIIENYQNTASVEDALGLMAVAYREMGLSDLEQDTIRVLRTNFPQSPYLKELTG